MMSPTGKRKKRSSEVFGGETAPSSGVVLLEVLLAVILVSVALLPLVQALLLNLRAACVMGEKIAAIFLLENQIADVLVRGEEQAEEQGTFGQALLKYRYSSVTKMLKEIQEKRKKGITTYVSDNQNKQR